jgi:xanthine/CO dehydrogenase XdhC/CoxF family maturation factor
MHELDKLATAAQRLIDDGKRGLLVTVVGTRGSTYRRAGARVIISENGESFGAISGGCLERDLAARAHLWLADFHPRVFTYDASRTDDVVFGLGLGCRGEIELLIEPFGPALPPRIPVPSGREVMIQGTVVSTSARHAIGDRIEVAEPVEKTCRMDIDGSDVLVEVIHPQRAIVIFGSGPDTKPVAAMADLIGWRAEISGSRTLPDLAAYDAAIVMTHNFHFDAHILRALFASQIAYIGLLGPKSRGQELLREIGVATAPSHLHSPIGLDVGAETPDEIALSIAAEIQATFAQRSGKPLRDSAQPIHDAVAAFDPTCA